MSICGHEEQIFAFLSAMRGDKMHHAWLLAGPQGVGKASVAKALAKRLLCEAAGPPLAGEGIETPPEHPIGKLVDAQTHPDFVVLERLPKDPKILREVERRDWPADFERVRSITVEQVRTLSGQFALMPSFSHRRIVVIDTIDDMERAGANALLKSLEEPPQGTIFLLVSHSPGRLLPTIRSRCRVLRFAGLNDAAMRAVLRDHLPSADAAEVTSLMSAAPGSPGRALGFAGLDISAIDEKLRAILTKGDQTNALRTSIASSLATKAAQRRYEAFLARAPTFIAEVARDQSGDALKRTLDAWDAVRSLTESAMRQSLDPYMAAFAVASHIAALAPKDASAKA